MSNYFISNNTLQAIANSVKNQTGTTDKITISQMVDKIDSVRNETVNQIITGECSSFSNDFITKIAEYKFYYRTNLIEVDLPAVTDVAALAFAGSGVNAVNLPNATSLGNQAFSYCNSLTDITFNNVLTVGQSCFSECEQLTAVNFPVATEFGQSAFYKCTMLTDINAPLLTTINSRAFEYCSSIVSFDSPNVSSILGSAFQYCSKLENVNLPSVTTIGSYCFKGTKLSSVDNMPLLTSIPESAFSSCGSLKSVFFPEVTHISQYGFSSCSNLVDVKMPKLTSVDKMGFYWCSSLQKIDLPSLTSINGVSVFSACNALTALILRSETMCKLETADALNGTSYHGPTPIESGTGYIYVPATLIDTYKADSVWSTFATQIRAIEDYPDICSTNE